MATIKQLPTSPRTKVFRAITAILRHDPVLASVIKPESFREWSGKSHDTLEFSFSSAPALRFTPMNGPEEWKFPEAFVGELFIKVEMLVAGTDADDVLNLWWGIEKALYPNTQAQQQANVAALQAAGAYTGLCEFSQPAFDGDPQDRFFAALGQIKCKVLLQLTG